MKDCPICGECMLPDDICPSCLHGMNKDEGLYAVSGGEPGIIAFDREGVKLVKCFDDSLKRGVDVTITRHAVKRWKQRTPGDGAGKELAVAWAAAKDAQANNWDADRVRYDPWTELTLLVRNDYIVTVMRKDRVPT